VKRFADKPMQTMLAPMVEEGTLLLARPDFLVLVSTGSAFITSDHPCVWFDPKGYKQSPLYQAPALIYESIEITLPVSPRQLILLNRRGLSGYVRSAGGRGRRVQPADALSVHGVLREELERHEADLVRSGRGAEDS
jgi:uncharacterized protein DUF4238